MIQGQDHDEKVFSFMFFGKAESEDLIYDFDLYRFIGEERGEKIFWLPRLSVGVHLWAYN